MPGIPARLCWGRSLGAYISQDRITVTEAAGGLGGTAVLARHECLIDEEGPGAALKRLLEQHWTPRQRQRMFVCLGIGAEQTFFITRHFEAEGQQDSPTAERLLAATGTGGIWEAGQALADYAQVKLAGRQAYSVAACRRELGEQLQSALKEAGVEHCRLEPAPWSVLAAAESQAKAGKKWKLAIHVLLEEAPAPQAQPQPPEPTAAEPSPAPAAAQPDEKNPAGKAGAPPLDPQGKPAQPEPAEAAVQSNAAIGLALLVAEGKPVLWRRFTMPADQQVLAIASAVRSLLVHAVQALGIRSVGGIVLQGPASEALVDQVTEESGMDATQVGGGGLSREMYSLGLALSGRKKNLKSLDLLRSLRPPPSLREIFPWKLAGFILLMGGAMGLMLLDKSLSLAGECQRLRRQNATHKWASTVTTPGVDAESKRLTADVGAVSRFLGTRILWSEYLRDLPTRLPPNACLSNLSAWCEMKDASKKKEQARKANKSLTMNGQTLYAARSAGQPRSEVLAAPKEIDALLESLRNIELLKRDFPLVSLAEIKWKREGESEIASFTIVALPKDKGEPSEEEK